jgi:hypothetical protein
MTTGNYDPNLYTLVIAGLPITDGYADGEFIKVERESDAFVDVAGTGGDVARAKQQDKRATCTFTTLQTAKINAALSALAAIDENNDNGAGVGPFLLKDRGGLSIHAAQECWIMRMPDVTLDKGVTGRQWKVRIAKIKSFEGGN